MLKERINKEMKNFMKAKDKVRLITIREVNADIKNKEIYIKRELNDDDIIAIIEKNIKQYKETLAFAEKANDQKRINEINISIELLKEFMPEQFTDKEAKAIIEDIIKENGFEGQKDMGKVMKEVMPKLKGRFDGKKINKIVKEILN
ncbi:TPA: GatB/YqeY domain-containing protein [Clostridium botulinum]|nr:GatB/YqeY domain-containing protein [Clostridium botulinum]